MTFLTLLLLAASPDAGVTAAAEPGVLEVLTQQARAYAPHVESPWVKRFLELTPELPPHPPQVFLHTPDKQAYFIEAQAAKLPPEQRASLVRREVDDETYYARVTDPLAYARPLDLLAAQGFTPKGKKVLDFGYGNIGQLKLLAWLGADVTGIEVDPLLPLLYAKENGPAVAKDGTRGRLRVLHGFFPTDRKLVASVGRGYDLFISKNTLKRGYIHPERPAPEKQLIRLGVTDAQFLKQVFDLLRPGGYALIYNLAPKLTPIDQPFQPASDGRCAFHRDAFTALGFEVVAHDVDDSQAGRVMAKAFEWGSALEAELVAHHTLVRRPL